MNSNKLEVLSPCGDIKSIPAAVLNGANAVYLGQNVFSARQNATNFDCEELIDAVCYCHSRGVKVYQTLNTLIFNSQLDLLLECIKNGLKASIDAFIIQDFAAYEIIKEICPDISLHASTQMAVHSLKGAELLKDMGFKRVVLARELSFEQIKEISNNVDIETEVFVQGALCMSVSGQCYISGMLGTRSGNRGNCAGTCRLPFSSDNKASNDLSLKDLCLAPHIDKLKLAGVTSIKIEGRMKRPEYVAEASSVYSKAVLGEEFETETLQAVFSRGEFTDSYFQNAISKDMFGIRQKEDVVSATSTLLKSIENSYKKEKPLIPIEMKISIKENEKIHLTATDIDGNFAESFSLDFPEKAINKSTTEEAVISSISKLGSTYFFIKEITCSIDEGLSVKASTLNELRRNVCTILEEKRATPTPLSFKEDFIFNISPKANSEKLKFRARFELFSQIDFSMLDILEYIILPVDEVIDNTESLIKYSEKLIIEPYRVMYQNETEIIKKLENLKKLGFSQIYASNLAHIKIANELEMKIFGSPFLNCTNSVSAASFKKMGLEDITLSFELNLLDAKKINADIKTGLFIYGNLPLMLFKSCPIKSKFSCKDCGGNKMLKDRMGIWFKVICNRQKYSELLNSTPLYLADRLDEFSFLDFATLYFTTEQKSECNRIFEEYKEKAPSYGSFTRGLYYRSI